MKRTISPQDTSRLTNSMRHKVSEVPGGHQDYSLYSLGSSIWTHPNYDGKLLHGLQGWVRWELGERS